MRDDFDDGLIHNHSWAKDGDRIRDTSYPIADVSALRTVSTVHHDEHVHPSY